MIEGSFNIIVKCKSITWNKVLLDIYQWAELMGQCVNFFYLYYITELCTLRHCIHNNMYTNIWVASFLNWSSFPKKTSIDNNMSDYNSLIQQSESTFNNISDNSLQITTIPNISAIIVSKENETGKLYFAFLFRLVFGLFFSTET